MTLTKQQHWVATKIDTRMQKLMRAGKDNLAIMRPMADHMPAFHPLLNTAEPDAVDQGSIGKCGVGHAEAASGVARCSRPPRAAVPVASSAQATVRPGVCLSHPTLSDASQRRLTGGPISRAPRS